MGVGLRATALGRVNSVHGSRRPATAAPGAGVREFIGAGNTVDRSLTHPAQPSPVSAPRHPSNETPPTSGAFPASHVLRRPPPSPEGALRGWGAGALRGGGSYRGAARAGDGSFRGSDRGSARGSERSRRSGAV